MDLERIKACLNRTRGATAWTLRRETTEATAVLRLPRIYHGAAGRTESVANPHPREAIFSPGETVEATVYSEHGTGGDRKVGDATGQIVSDDDAATDALVGSLVEAARNQRNAPFPLPGREEPYPEVALADPELAAAPRRALPDLAYLLGERLLAAADQHPRVAVSNLEVFLQRGLVQFETSAGARLLYARTSVHLEVCVLARASGGNVGEHTARRSARRLADLDADAILDECAAAACDAARAGSPPRWQGPVVLVGEAAADFFLLPHTPLAFHADARSVYEKSGRYAKGKPLWDDLPLKGTPLSAISDPLVPYAVGSAPCSCSEGSACRPVRVVTNGCYDELLGERRYYHYLGLLGQGIAPPGVTGNTVMPGGELAAQDLLTADAVVVRSFSAFGADRASGQLSVEIRLGEVRRAGSSTPFKGGLLIGNWFDALADAHYSKELQRRGAYHGPRAVRFGALQVAG